MGEFEFIVKEFLPKEEFLLNFEYLNKQNKEESLINYYFK